MKKDRARAIIQRGHQILMIERIKAGETRYVLPGGKIEEGESPEAAVMREVREETSLETKLIKKLGEVSDKDGNTHHIYLCEYLSGTPLLAHDSPEASEAGNTYTPTWVDISAIETLPMWPHIQPLLVSYFKPQT